MKSYRELIYDAFMSQPGQEMTLQELYQWFRDNTEMANDTSGWQASIRYNLSMNKVCFPFLSFSELY